MPPLRSFPTNSDLTARTLVCANATAQYDDDEKQYDSSETARIVSRLLVPSCSFRLFSLFWNRSGVVVNPAPPGAMGHNGLAECPTDLYPDKTVFHDVKPAVLKAEHVELTVFVHAVLALGGSQMVAKYSAEKIATTLIAHDIESVSVLKLILMDEGSTRHLTDKLEGVAPFGLVALMKAHLQSNPLGKKPKTVGMRRFRHHRMVSHHYSVGMDKREGSKSQSIWEESVSHELANIRTKVVHY